MRFVGLALVMLAACGSSLPGPPKGEAPATSFVEVPFPPPPARPELVPRRPNGEAVWVDGSWEWTGTRWRWKDGGWFQRPAPGIVFTDWQARRPGGTVLVYSAAAWRDHSGAKVPPPQLLASAALVSSMNDEDGGTDAGPSAPSEGPPDIDGGAPPDGATMPETKGDGGKG